MTTVIDPRLTPRQLLAVGRFFELNGDALSAVKAYRDVVLSGEAAAVDEARRRLAELVLPQRSR